MNIFFINQTPAEPFNSKKFQISSSQMPRASRGGGLRHNRVRGVGMPFLLRNGGDVVGVIPLAEDDRADVPIYEVDGSVGVGLLALDGAR